MNINWYSFTVLMFIDLVFLKLQIKYRHDVRDNDRREYHEHNYR